MSAWRPRGPGRRLEVESLVARLLAAGGLLSLGVILFGLVAYGAQGGLRGGALDLRPEARPGAAAVPRGTFASPAEVARGLAARPMDALAVVDLGLLVLLATPALGVAAAIPAFLAAGDRRYASIAAIVLAMLVVSALLAGGAG